MTPQEAAFYVRCVAKCAGMTVQEFANRIDHATQEEISQAMEALPTDALEFAVRFEALGQRGKNG